MLNESTEPAHMFWGVVLKPEKRYEQTVEEPFHISKACIEANTSKGSVTSVFIEVDDEEFLICNLSDKILSETLDLNFNGGDKIVFKTTGNGTVHLTGYNIMQESGDDMYEDFSGEEESEEEDEEEEAPKLVNGKRKRSGTGDELAAPAKKVNKEMSPLDKLLAEKKKSGPGTAKEEKKQAEDLRKKLNAKKAEEEDIEESDDEDDDSEDANDSDDDDANDFINDEADETNDESADGGDDEDDGDDDDEDMETDETKSPKKSPQKSPKKEVNGTPAVKEIATKKEKKKNKNKAETPVSSQTSNASSVKSEPKSPGPDGDATQSAKKKKKKKKNKNKENEVNATNTPAKGANTPGKDSSKAPSGQEKTPGKEQPQTPKTPKRTLKGGLMVEDLKPGNGPEAKKGKLIGMYYDGKLKSNMKRFDATLNGKPFKFRLGAGEVIKGWDAGIEGMKVGGKRRLTVPAHMAYGKQGAPPEIPPNATLVFDVECKAVN